MILTGEEIRRQVATGAIFIENFNSARLGPNSYNLRLAPDLLVYREAVLDMAKDNRTRRLTIPPEGMVLKPGKLYLGRTLERTRTDKFVPMLEGRSSVGRLGMGIHVTAGFGDIGFDGPWTLEITVTEPLRIYPMVEIAQIYFHVPAGETSMQYRGKYQWELDVVPSRLWRELT